MAISIDHPWPIICSYVIALIVAIANGADVFLEWHVATSDAANPVPKTYSDPVITINGMFPGPLINVTIGDAVHVNVFNDMSESLLFTWNGLQQRLNSWQDGVSGTNCPILPGKNWTYVLQNSDQIGSFFYFPSINFHKAGGGFGPIRINEHKDIKLPFPKPEAEFDILIGEWYDGGFQYLRNMFNFHEMTYIWSIDWMLLNGKGQYNSDVHERFTVKKGKTYRFRISHVGFAFSINFKIQNHSMVLVETEGSYTNQMALDSLDVHVGQSYSVLVTADKDVADYHIVATPKLLNYDVHRDYDMSTTAALGVLHYENSTTPPNGPLPIVPDPFDPQFSINQAKSIRLNSLPPLINLKQVKLSQTFTLGTSFAWIDGIGYYMINNVSYSTPDTPLKLVDYFGNESSFNEQAFPTNTTYDHSVRGVFVANCTYKEWIEIVFKNDLKVMGAWTNMDAWHLDGYHFFVVGFGDGEWTPESRSTYNLLDPILRSTVQVYIGGWTAVYVYLDNPGMWNLRSQLLANWYLGQEFYLRVYSNSTNEQPPPDNLLLCGKYTPILAAAPAPSASARAQFRQIAWFHILMIYFVIILYIG